MVYMEFDITYMGSNMGYGLSTTKTLRHPSSDRFGQKWTSMRINKPVMMITSNYDGGFV